MVAIANNSSNPLESTSAVKRDRTEWEREGGEGGEGARVYTSGQEWGGGREGREEIREGELKRGRE